MRTEKQSIDYVTELKSGIDYEEIGDRWIKQAVHDLQIAEKNLTIGGFDSAAFYSHQSVEKLPKGLISMSGHSIPRIHDLKRPGDLLECPDDIMIDLIDLMGDYLSSRYPDMSEVIPCEYYTKTIAKDSVRKAQKVFTAYTQRGIIYKKDPVIDVFRSEILPKLITFFHPEEVILFGSRIVGTAHDESDLDVILVSASFRDVPQHERFPVVRKRIRTPYSIDYLCYTPEEFERMKTRSSVLESALTGLHQTVLGTV
ncbi:MAG: HEPN domain-containing protein [Methanospirillaceae archaeon]|nr:HEPN domain-containing protein [Methanospirillaceae archaeon]